MRSVFLWHILPPTQEIKQGTFFQSSDTQLAEPSNVQTTPPLPPRLSRSQRRDLFGKCASQITSDYPSGWFLPSNSDIKRDNVYEWILWALFASTPEHASPEWEQEIDEYISTVEKSLGRKLEPGRASDVKSLRLSFDPIHMLHRPLIWYMVRVVCHVMRSAPYGFTDCSISRYPHLCFPSFPGI